MTDPSALLLAAVLMLEYVACRSRQPARRWEALGKRKQ
jgi:hypothetical protein